jgi:hypothetical protein
MKLFFWENNRAVDEFAKALADDMFSRIQPSTVSDYFAEVSGVPLLHKLTPQKQKLQKKEVEDKIKEAVLKVQQFKSTQSIGIYRKARLHLVFTERLKELGFDADIAQEINRTILLQTP